MNRETIYSALFSALTAATGVVTASRVEVNPNNVTPGQCPCLLMEVLPEEITNPVIGAPMKVRLRVDAMVLVAVPASQEPLGAETQIPMSQVTPLVDAIAQALAPDAPGVVKGKFTLGGLVEHCYIEGQILYSHGRLKDIAGALVPIELLTTDPYGQTNRFLLETGAGFILEEH